MRAVALAALLLASAPAAAHDDRPRHRPHRHRDWQGPPGLHHPPPPPTWRRPFRERDFLEPPPMVYGEPYRVNPVPYGCGDPYCHNRFGGPRRYW